MEENFRNFSDENGTCLNIVDFTKQARNLPYFNSQRATNLNPVLTGVHASQRGHAEFTFSFSDGSYVMAMSWRKRGVLPINSRGRFKIESEKMLIYFSKGDFFTRNLLNSKFLDTIFNTN